MGGWVVGISLDVAAMERSFRVKVELLLYPALLFFAGGGGSIALIWMNLAASG